MAENEPEPSWQAGRPAKLIRVRPKNPFQEPESNDVFAQKADTARRNRANRKEMRQMNITDRALMQAPKKTHRMVMKNYEEALHPPRDPEKEVAPAREFRQKRHPPSKLIEEQRELFLSNLLIDRHEQELGRIRYQQKTKEARLDALELESKDQQNRTKTTTSQIESERTRVRQKLEEQTKKRREVEQQMKRKQRTNEAMEQEIAKLEDQLAQYRAYDHLLEDIESAYGKRPQSTPDLIDFFDNLENESLFIIHHVENFKVKFEESQGDLKTEEERVLASLKKVTEDIQQCQQEKAIELAKIGQKKPIANDTIDESLTHILNAISKVYKTCYPHSDCSQNPLTMLGTLEAEIDEMTQKLRFIDPAFVSKRMKQLILEKRAKQREANAAKKKHDQHVKIQQMLERATRPVKKKEGRPLMTRAVPQKVQRRDTEKIKLEQLERDRVEALLYGPVFAD